MVNYSSTDPWEWRMPILALTGKNHDNKIRSFSLIPQIAPTNKNLSIQEPNAHALISIPRIISHQKKAAHHPYQFYEFQGERRDFLFLSSAEPIHYTNWENWSEILSFLSIDEILKEQRQSLFFYQLLLNSLPLNVYFPLGKMSFEILKLIQNKPIRKITDSDISALAENCCV